MRNGVQIGTDGSYETQKIELASRSECGGANTETGNAAAAKCGDRVSCNHGDGRGKHLRRGEPLGGLWRGRSVTPGAGVADRLIKSAA